MPKTILTDKGVQKITQAAGSQALVQITDIALGDGEGVKYDPSFSQTALKRELARQAITRRQVIGQNSWRVKAEFGTDTPAFWVREIGFFDEDGDLIALWAGADVDPRPTGAITYLIDHVLTFSRVQDGVIIVNAPDDETFELAVNVGTAIANLQLEQLRQADEIRALGGQY